MLLTGAARKAAPLGLMDLDRATSQPPRAILFLVSVIAIAGGILIIWRRDTKRRNLVAGVMLSAFAAMGGWTAMFGPAERISGGLAFLSPEANVRLARILFGAGAGFCLILGVFALLQG